jgi:hypothetical protein
MTAMSERPTSDTECPNEPRASTLNTPPSSAPVTTNVLWREVTGIQLEELLHGLLDAMGASNLVWRAGTGRGANAPDGGRDLEATFDRPSPDGQLDRQRWWIESKGRSGTVERAAVQQAVLDASARSDIDVVVIATNSRFSNPTRDWVVQHQDTHRRPAIRLWDRDSLDQLVRRHPTVVARVLPGALADDDRLKLLVSRFEELGEEPTDPDKEYFWERRQWMQDHELLTEALVMLLYAEGEPLPKTRTWWTLVENPLSAARAIVAATVRVPWLLASNPDRARPLDQGRCLAAAARLIMTAFCSIPDKSAAVDLVLNPWRFVVDGETVMGDQAEYDRWCKGELAPILAWLSSDLLGPCSCDCPRVTADSVHEVESLSAKEFWRLVHGGEDTRNAGVLVLEARDETPCTVGLDVRSHGCPLITSNRISPGAWISQLYSVIRFRKTRPDDARPKDLPSEYSRVAITILYDGGLTWRHRGAEEQ